MRPLYAIGTDLLKLNDLLDAVQGDLSRHAEGEEEITRWLCSLESEQAAKMDNYIGYINQLEMEQARAKDEERYWKDVATQKANRIELLKTQLIRHMQETGQSKIESAKGRVVAVQQNGGSQPMTIDSVALDQVPPEFVVTVSSINKDAVKTALLSGRELGFARLEPRGVHLRIR